MRIAWLSYLDSSRFHGGAELSWRKLIETGRRRGHVINEAPFLRSKPQRVLRRTGLHRGVRVDWDADVFVIHNIRNVPHLRARFPESAVDRALATGRAAVLQDAWVDVCRFDVPCRGDVSRCLPACDRSFARSLYSAARAAVFVSPLHMQTVASVLDVPLPDRCILRRPALDVEAFRPLGLERDIDVLYVGTISRAKGYYNLLDRFGPERLTFVGRSVLDEPVAGTYLGPRPYEELPEIYNRARTFAHLPEWIEPMGRAVAEAALCGCELELNSRVGVATYPEADWQDPAHVARNPDRFWDDFERAITWA